MRQVFRKIPVYTGDVSGVCSALFELGGMVVMHDPSGCNSTYNTHDETRWYDRDSLIFLSGLNETDAILGSDEKLIRDTVEAARLYSPSFIAIVNSPIPYITGMDFDAICRIIEKETGIPSFYIMTNGMHDYTRGAGLAFLELAKRFVEEKKPREQDPAVFCNLLGLTPLDFAASSTVRSLYRKLAEADLKPLSNWAMEGEPGFSGDPLSAKEKSRSLLDGIRRSASADVSLVLSSAGLPAAEYLRKKYGVPYVAGIPAEGTEERYFAAVRRAVKTGENQFPFRDRTDLPGSTLKPPVCLLGEPVLMTSLAASVQIRTGAGTHVFCMTESGAELVGNTDFCPRGEEALHAGLEKICGEQEALKYSPEKNTCPETAAAGSRTEKDDRGETAAVRVIADPCYADVLPENCQPVRLPHLAFSGRIFLKEIPDLIAQRI